MRYIKCHVVYYVLQLNIVYMWYLCLCCNQNILFYLFPLMHWYFYNTDKLYNLPYLLKIFLVQHNLYHIANIKLIKEWFMVMRSKVI